jgi:hypothetical protein
MAIIFLPLNGIGWGHLSRAYAIADWLGTQGHAPVIFAQGDYPDFMASTVPGMRVGTIYEAGLWRRRRIRMDLTDYARLTSPSIVIEDTHPAPILLPKDVSRILLVRPLSMPHLRRLRNRYERVHRLFLIIDAPESPTWPFSSKETAEIHTWSRWFAVGPVYRESSREASARVRETYSIAPNRKVYVFSMGGGGAQPTARGEHEFFCERASALAEAIRSTDPSSRFLFVRGGLFPKEIRLPSLFEDISVEPNMPGLIAEASGAVIRPTYNAIWECIRGATPFLPIVGTTFREPVAERLDRLTKHGLIAKSVAHWQDAAWLESFRSRCALLAQRWSLESAAGNVYRLAIPAVRNRHTNLAFDFRTTSIPEPASGFPLAIRIDAVAEINEDLLRALELCASRGLKVSLEVIPYLCRMDEAMLRAATSDRVAFEVAQHGFARLPRHTGSDRRAEFIDPRKSEEELRLGIGIMRQHFPTAFHGGFSAPFDVTPEFLPELWSRVGGTYMSSREAPGKSAVPVVSLTLDPWKWRARSPFGSYATLASARRAISDRGYAGLVIHARRLRSHREAKRLTALIDRLLRTGGRSAFVSEIARAFPARAG